MLLLYYLDCVDNSSFMAQWPHWCYQHTCDSLLKVAGVLMTFIRFNICQQLAFGLWASACMTWLIRRVFCPVSSYLVSQAQRPDWLDDTWNCALDKPVPYWNVTLASSLWGLVVGHAAFRFQWEQQGELGEPVLTWNTSCKKAWRLIIEARHTKPATLAVAPSSPAQRICPPLP